MPGAVSTGPSRTWCSNAGADRTVPRPGRPAAQSTSATAARPDGGRAETLAQPHSPSTGASHRAAPNQPPMCCRTTTSEYLTSVPGDGLSNGAHRPRHDQIDAELSELGARSTRIPMHALARPQAIGADQTGVDGEGQRGVGETGMGADLVLAIALALQQLSEFGLTGAVVL